MLHAKYYCKKSPYVSVVPHKGLQSQSLFNPLKIIYHTLTLSIHVVYMIVSEHHLLATLSQHIYCNIGQVTKAGS